MKSFTFLLLFIVSVVYSQEPTKKEINWLKKQIIPLNTYIPNSKDNNDLIAFGKIIGNAQIVSFGEVAHGSSENYQMKHRLTKYLSQNKGFNIFSLEANMPEASRINDYINNRNNENIDELLKGLHFWVWKTQETLDLINWMKKSKKIDFTGFDMQFYQGAIKILKENLHSEPKSVELIAKIETRLIEFNELKWKKKKYIQLKKGRTEFNNDLVKLKTIINNSNFRKIKKDWLIQNCRIIKQFTSHYASASKDPSKLTRDKYMAENVLWLKKEKTNSKIIVSAQNGHIATNNSYNSMGNFLKDALGEKYLSIGFAISEGSFTAHPNRKGKTTYNFEKSYKGTYEYYFNLLNEPFFILDLRKIKNDKSKESEFIKKALKFRTIGAGYGKHQFSKRNLIESYDVIIFINKSTNSKLLFKNHT